MKSRESGSLVEYLKDRRRVDVHDFHYSAFIKSGILYSEGETELSWGRADAGKGRIAYVSP